MAVTISGVVSIAARIPSPPMAGQDRVPRIVFGLSLLFLVLLFGVASTHFGFFPGPQLAGAMEQGTSLFARGERNVHLVPVRHPEAGVQAPQQGRVAAGLTLVTSLWDDLGGMAGARLLVLGHGAVGGRVAAIGRAFGMRVDAVTRHGQPAPGLERTGTTAALRALLAEADAIVCCLPDTPATAGLLNAAAFAAMKPGAVFVNVGRGACVDEGALHDALTGGRLGAAGLDTWWRYPTVPEERAACPPGRRDWAGVENVVLSPHRASHAEGREEARMDALAALLNAIARGAPPRPVDLAEGY